MEQQIIPKEKALQQIEINGIKFEVDLRQAKRIDTFKIGDPIKVLKKEYSDSWKQYNGVVVDFVEFVKRPTIIIAYLDISYNAAKIEFININQDSDVENIDIAPCNQYELTIDKSDVIRLMDKEIENKREEIRDIEFKRNLFVKYFNKYFQDVVIDKQIEGGQ